MPKKIINLKWIFNYSVRGKGTPIVLLHGLGGHPVQWHEYSMALSKYHTVITPNLNHIFYSGEKLSFADQVNILNEFLDQIGQEYGVLNIAGQSFGGTLAIALAIKEKDIVDRIILINPFPPWPIQYFRNSFLRFFLRTSILLSDLKSGLLKTQVGVQFLKELQLVFPWRWLTQMVNDKNFTHRRFEMLHSQLERFAWNLQQENWDNWNEWNIPANKVLMIFDPKDPLLNPMAYPDLISKLKIEHVIELKHSGHILVQDNKFEIQLGIRRFLEPSYADEFKVIRPPNSMKTA